MSVVWCEIRACAPLARPIANVDAPLKEYGFRCVLCGTEFLWFSLKEYMVHVVVALGWLWHCGVLALWGGCGTVGYWHFGVVVAL